MWCLRHVLCRVARCGACVMYCVGWPGVVPASCTVWGGQVWCLRHVLCRVAGCGACVMYCVGWPGVVPASCTV